MREDAERELLTIIRTAVNEAASKHDMIASPRAIDLLLPLVCEALEDRQGEWTAKSIPLFPRYFTAGREEITMETVGEADFFFKAAIIELVDGAAQAALQQGRRHGTIEAVDILDQIRMKWCRVFPFCR